MERRAEWPEPGSAAVSLGIESLYYNKLLFQCQQNLKNNLMCHSVVDHMISIIRLRLSRQNRSPISDIRCTLLSFPEATKAQLFAVILSSSRDRVGQTDWEWETVAMTRAIIENDLSYYETASILVLN